MIKQTITPKIEKAKALFVDSHIMVVQKGKVLNYDAILHQNTKFEKKFNQYGDSLKKKLKRNKINASEFVLTGISAAVSGILTGGVAPVVGFIGKIIGVPLLKIAWRQNQHYGKVSTVITQEKVKAFGGNAVEIFDYKTLGKRLKKRIQADKSLFKHIRHHFTHRRHQNITTYVNLVMVMRGYYDHLKDFYTEKVDRQANKFNEQYSCMDFIRALQLIFAYYKAYRKSLDFASTFTACYHFVEEEVNRIESEFESMIRLPYSQSGLHTRVGLRLRRFLQRYNRIYEKYEKFYPKDGTMDNRKISSTRRLRTLKLSAHERYKAEVAYKVNQYYIHSVLSQIMMCTSFHQERIKGTIRGETYYDCVRKKLKIDEGNLFWKRVNNQFNHPPAFNKTGSSLDRSDVQRKHHTKKTATSQLGINVGTYGVKAVGLSAKNTTGQQGANLFTNSGAGYLTELKKNVNPMSPLWAEARQVVNLVDISLAVGFSILRAYNTKKNHKKLKKSDQEGHSLHKTSLRHHDKGYKRLQTLRTNLKKGLLENWQDAFLEYQKSDEALKTLILKKDASFPLEGAFFERHNNLLKLLWHHRYMKEFYEEVIEKVDRMTLRWLIMSNETVRKLDVFFDNAEGTKSRDKHGEETCGNIFCYSKINMATNVLRDKREDFVQNPMFSADFKLLKKIRKKRKTVLDKWGTNVFFDGEHMDQIMAQFKKGDVWNRRLKQFVKKREIWNKTH